MAFSLFFSVRKSKKFLVVLILTDGMINLVKGDRTGERWIVEEKRTVCLRRFALAIYVGTFPSIAMYRQKIRGSLATTCILSGFLEQIGA